MFIRWEKQRKKEKEEDNKLNIYNMLFCWSFVLYNAREKNEQRSNNQAKRFR